MITPAQETSLPETTAPALAIQAGLLDSVETPPAPIPELRITCDDCAAACCKLEVVCLTETGVPRHFTTRDAWGAITMDRLDDGWCAALDRDTLLCRIYDRRPLLCREFEMGGPDCLAEREAAWHNS
ncbi:YkgJ family cysteine cluster protein [Allochromatium humboldtianum]|uniref:YkgJ family cysteine cluster protein n=1 Tax=Allochromatium humboldtianum TaxID=504901 RepID=A0A850RIQ8_9GAMM|nr:YkgJ family cysteine cluster protein [Allochromatium humboldtianum]NVZ10982.1 YkgJ family cysteine cluster protein [Allochromatium humboldtianum]